MSNKQIKQIAVKKVVDELRKGNVVAAPSGEGGIELEAHVGSSVCRIKVLANDVNRFGVQQKWKNIPNLLLVYVWNLESADPDIYPLTYLEAVGLLQERGHTKTKAWRELQGYSLKAGQWWKNRLPEFRLKPETWRSKIEFVCKGN